MPTAGEYKHEPTGIPCHCYVRRRLHHSACRKSCLRKQSDSSSQYSDSKPKKVSFNPILSVRSYDSDSAETPESKKPPSKCARNEKKRSQNVTHTSTLCDKLSSLFGLSHCKPSPKYEAELNKKSSKDYNNNDLHQSGNMNGERNCSLCESKRNRSPVRGSLYQRTRERTPSPCGFHQPYSSRKGSESPLYQRYASTSEYSVQNSRQTPFTNRYHSPRRLFRRDSFSCASNRDDSAGYENMDTLSFTASATPTVDLNRLITYIDGKPNRTNQMNQGQPIPIPITIKSNTEVDKSEEYIYEIPINNKQDKRYEYISIKSNNKKLPESDNYQGNVVTIPISENSSYTSSGLVKHKTEIDLTEETIRHKITRPRNTNPSSSSDLPAVIASPYDIQFVHEPPKRPNPRNSEEQVEMFDRSSTLDTLNSNTVMFGPRRAPQKRNTPLADILKLTPIAFFWTGCAFLIAMVYVCLFPCPIDDED